MRHHAPNPVSGFYRRCVCSASVVADDEGRGRQHAARGMRHAASGRWPSSSLIAFQISNAVYRFTLGCSTTSMTSEPEKRNMWTRSALCVMWLLGQQVAADTLSDTSCWVTAARRCDCRCVHRLLDFYLTMVWSGDDSSRRRLRWFLESNFTQMTM